MSTDFQPETISAFLDGEMSEDQARAFLREIERQPEAKAELQRMLKLRELLADACRLEPAAEKVPPALQARWQEAVRAEAAHRPAAAAGVAAVASAGGSRVVRPQAGFWRAAVPVAATLLMAAGVLLYFRQAATNNAGLRGEAAPAANGVPSVALHEPSTAPKPPADAAGAAPDDTSTHRQRANDPAVMEKPSPDLALAAPQETGGDKAPDRGDEPKAVADRNDAPPAKLAMQPGTAESQPKGVTGHGMTAMAGGGGPPPPPPPTSPAPGALATGSGAAQPPMTTPPAPAPATMNKNVPTSPRLPAPGALTAQAPPPAASAGGVAPPAAAPAAEDRVDFARGDDGAPRMQTQSQERGPGPAGPGAGVTADGAGEANKIELPPPATATATAHEGAPGLTAAARSENAAPASNLAAETLHIPYNEQNVVLIRRWLEARGGKLEVVSAEKGEPLQGPAFLGLVSALEAESSAPPQLKAWVPVAETTALHTYLSGLDRPETPSLVSQPAKPPVNAAAAAAADLAVHPAAAAPPAGSEPAAGSMAPAAPAPADANANER